MTEEEARNKRCPLLLKSFGAQLCFGSSCMAWRWVQSPIPDEPVYAGVNKGHIGSGFCGLAGNPDPIFLMGADGNARMVP